MKPISDEAVEAAVRAHNDAVLAVQGDLYDFGTIDEFMRPALEAALAAQRAEIADQLDKWAEDYDYEGMVALGKAADRVRANVPSDPPAAS